MRGIPASLIVGEDELAAVRQAQMEANQEMAALGKTAEMAQAVGQAAPMIKALMPKGPA